MKRFISVMLVFFMVAHAASQSQARMPEWSWSDSTDLLTSSSYLPTLVSASYQVVTESIYKTVTHPATGWVVGGLCTLYTAYKVNKSNKDLEKKCALYRDQYIDVTKKAGILNISFQDQLKKINAYQDAVLAQQKRISNYRSTIFVLCPSMKASLSQDMNEERIMLDGLREFDTKLD